MTNALFRYAHNVLKRCIHVKLVGTIDRFFGRFRIILACVTDCPNIFPPWLAYALFYYMMSTTSTFEYDAQGGRVINKYIGKHGIKGLPNEVIT